MTSGGILLFLSVLGMLVAGTFTILVWTGQIDLNPPKEKYEPPPTPPKKKDLEPPFPP